MIVVLFKLLLRCDSRDQTGFLHLQIFRLCVFYAFLETRLLF